MPKGIINKSSEELVLKDRKWITSFPKGVRWQRHLREDLLPFWTNKDALGEPIGNFPTYRADDGTVVNTNNLPTEFRNVISGIVFLDRDYVRAKSRQIFAYGVTYHMTGDEKYLVYAKAGVDYLFKYALDDYGACSWFKLPDRTPSPNPMQRTSQDLAYAVSGIAFYYYLTRDKKIEKRILELKKYIFETYWDEGIDMLKWVVEPNQDKDSPDQKELVSQLDQIYGYLLLLAPSLPLDEQRIAKKELQRLAWVIIKHFFVKRYGLFWGSVTTTERKRLDTSHTDFGHSVKTMWMIMQIGKLTNNLELFNFGRNGAVDIINLAFDPIKKIWMRGYKKNSIMKKWIMDFDKEWWAFTILDQVAATLSLNDPDYAEMLIYTYSFWFKYMVDQKNHGVWHMLEGKTNLPSPGFPKQHSWKNAFHTFEHALIGYLCSQAIHNLDISLYFAFEKDFDPKTQENRKRIHPYFYQAAMKEIDVSRKFKGKKKFLKNLVKTRVVFSDLR
jgi:mannose/cellobiose epimerase-like protein (N-acyl-D-glucosamine 2-epimerase family)